MATQGLDHINLRAQRAMLDELKNFYCQVIGLHEGFRPAFAGFGYWLYAQESAIVHLYEAGPGEERQTGVATTIDHFAFSCSNIAEFEARLQQLDIRYRKAQVPLINQVQLFMQDPAGNKLELNFADTNA